MSRWLLREEARAGGAAGPARLCFQPALNVLLLAAGGRLTALDVNSAAPLQRAVGGAEDIVGIQYLPTTDKIVVWNGDTLGVRSAYNGVLFLQTILQRPLQSTNAERTIKIELFLSEATLLYQCMKTIDLSSVEYSTEVLKALGDAIDKANASPKKGIKAQKWNTVCLELPYIALKILANTIVLQLKQQKRHVPALAIASALNQQISDLMLNSGACALPPQDANIREVMFSEAMRRETFKKWPHMDYKWALPAQMAQAGFFYQPANIGDDRAMCFSCGVCLVCWEKTDEPWSEHERHSPDCSLVKGEYTHNVPLPVTCATSPAVFHSGIDVVSTENSANIFLTGSYSGKVSIWNVDCKLKLHQDFMISVDDPIIQGSIHGPYSNIRKAWENDADRNSEVKLSALTILGQCINNEMPGTKNITVNNEDSQNDNHCVERPSIVCGVKIFSIPPSITNIWKNCENNANLKLDKPSLVNGLNYSIDGVQVMNDQNYAKSNSNVAANLYLIVYDFQGKCSQIVSPSNNSNAFSKNASGKSGGSIKYEGVANFTSRTDDSNIYDDIYLSKYMCLHDDSPEMALMAGLHDQVAVIDIKNLVAPNKEIDSKFPPPHEININSINNGKSLQNCIKFISKVNLVGNPQNSISIHPICQSSQDTNSEEFSAESVDKMLKPYKLCDTDSHSEIKLSDETDALVLDTKNVCDSHEIACIAGLMYEYKNTGIKMKVPYIKSSNAKSMSVKAIGNDSSEKGNTAKEDNPPVCRVVKCIPLPQQVNTRSDLTISHIMPICNGEFLLVVVVCDEVIDDSEQSNLANGFVEPMELNDFENSMPALQATNSEIYDSHVNMATSFLISYRVKHDSSVTSIHDLPEHIKEIANDESPVDICLLPNLEKSSNGGGLAAIVGRDGGLRLLNLLTFETVAVAKLDSSKFVSVTFCSNIEKLCACADNGTLYFYALRDNEGDSNAENEDEEIYFDPSDHYVAPDPNADVEDSLKSISNQTALIAHKNELDKDDFDNLMQLAGIGSNSDNVVAYSAVVPSCWCEYLPTQRSRTDNQYFNRSWRLQNTSSTWDEHVLELTLPWSSSISHVELKFTLHAPCPTPPNIQVTLLKQHLHGIGSKKESPKYFSRIDDQIDFNFIDSEPKGPVENPVRSKEYLTAQNAEILAGPLTLSQDLDLTQQAGTLTLTSPRLYRVRGRNLLIHIKTLFDPSKEANQGKVSSSKKSKLSEYADVPYNLPGSTVERFAMPSVKKKVESYIGCDWLHEISVTVRSNNLTGIPQERLQRIAMLESNYFFEKLLSIATSNGNLEFQSMALDLLIWIVSIRLTRYRNAKEETEEQTDDDPYFNGPKPKDPSYFINDIENLQHETIRFIQKNLTALIKNCVLLSKRSVTKKCVKLILICCKGVKNLDDEISLLFEMAILDSITHCLPLIGLVQCAGSLGWLTQLVIRSVSLDTEMRCASICVQLLKDIAGIMQSMYNPYHLILRSRFGLYGLPMEPTVFDIEPPALGKTLSIPLTYSSIVSGDTATSQAAIHQDIDLRDLYNYSGKSSSGWWSNENSICGNIGGLSEVMPLRVIFHNASDGTHLDTASAHQSCQSFFTINTDCSQFWESVSFKNSHEQEDTSTESNIGVDNSKTSQGGDANSAHCIDPTKNISDDNQSSENQSKDENKFANTNGLIPWQLLVQQPPQQIFVIKRMHPGARHFVVLDFGYPVKLTDLIFPACPEVVTLSIDIWLINEDQDCTRLVMAPDISTKNLIMTDIQPPPLCQYLKITTIGRYNMSTTRCKIPLGWFYGVIADSAVTNEQANISSLTALHQDLSCRFRLAVGKLTDCLDFYLETSSGNSAHLTADVDQQNESYPLVKSVYRECIEIQQQITTVERIMEHFHIVNDGNANGYESLDDIDNLSPETFLKQASIDKLKSITEQLTDILLYTCFECDTSMIKRLTSGFSMSTCELIMRWLIICGGGGGPRLEAGLASVLVRLCSAQPWWGTFIANSLAHLYSPSNTLIFSQNRVLILLVYMGRKSLYGRVGSISGSGGGVVECVSQLIIKLLPQPSDNNLQPIWQTTDLSLLSWLLIYLSACLDTAQPKDGSSNSWSRWSFLSGGNGGSSSNMNNGGNGSGKNSNNCNINRFHRRKFQKRLVHKGQIEDSEAIRKAYQMSQQVQALSALSSQATSLTNMSNAGSLLHNHLLLKNPDLIFKHTNKNQWVKRFEEFIQNRLTALNKRVAGTSSAAGGSARMSDNASGSSSADNDTPVLDLKPSSLISQQLALQISRSLISLILSMDFTCNTDVLLLACKVIGRLNGICGGLSSIIKEQELLELMRAACSPSLWPQHALMMLLQDLVEYDRAVVKDKAPKETSHCSMPIVVNEGADDSGHWLHSENKNDNPDIAYIDIGTKDGNIGGLQNAEYLMEFEEDFDIDDLFEEYPDRNRNFHRDIFPKPTNNSAMNGTSISVDARLGSGIEISGEILIRRLALLGGGSLAAAINSQPLPPIASINTTPPVEHAPILPTGDLTNMMTNSFHTLFTDLESQDNSQYLERVLQLWVTLNGCSSGISLNNTPPDSMLRPKIKLSTQALTSIIHSLNQQINVTLRCWVLGFQCLSWIANSSNDASLKDSTNNDGLVGVMLNDPQFIEMLVKFLSTNMETDFLLYSGEKPCVGPVACSTMACLLQRISSRSPGLARNAFLKVLCKLTAPGGALRNGRGPLDAQRELLRAAAPFARQLNSSHLPDAMSFIESIGVIITSICNVIGVEVFGIGESASNVSSVDLATGAVSGLGGLLAEALAVNTDVVKRDKPITRRDLIISLIIFARSLLLIPLRDTRMEDVECESTSEESQTDESKAIFGETPKAPMGILKVPCLSDTVLQHYPTMKRLFRALSSCTTSNIMYLTTSSGNSNATMGESLTFGDALYKFAFMLVQSTTHAKLIFKPLLDYLGHGAISEALVKLVVRSLEVHKALELFVSLGGIEIICSRLIESHKSQLSPQPGLVAALMNHLKQPSHILNLSSVTPTNPEKAQQNNMEISEGLLNYAPLGSISSGNPSAQQADTLLHMINNGSASCGNGNGGGGGHRRSRSAAWSHHFSRGETSIDLSVKLPHAILLHEVHLQPHISTVATCPSAVSLEVCAQGCIMIPLGPPQPTAGMTNIRLKLTKPLVVNTVLVRLYKPRDNSNMALSNMRILGTAAFTSPSSDKVEERLATTSSGWALILWKCLCNTENVAYLEARRRAASIPGIAEATAGLLLSTTSPVTTLRSLLLALGSESSTALRVLSLILYNGHIPAHQGYQYSSLSSVNIKTPMDSVCDLLYQLCTIEDMHYLQRIKMFIDWLKDYGESVISRARHKNIGVNTLNSSVLQTKYLSPIYIQCLASVLWNAKEQQSQYDLKELITKELFDTICAWIELLPKYATIKRPLNSVLCSICFIRPELFTRMLYKMGVLIPDTSSPMCIEESISDDRKDLEVREATREPMTDDIKVDREHNQSLKSALLENLRFTPSQLSTLSAACMSPDAIKILIKSNLLQNITKAIEEFCIAQNTGDVASQSMLSSNSDKSSGLKTLEMMPVLIEWLTCLCIDGEIKNWLGTSPGCGFWNPLLTLLCLRNSISRMWHIKVLYTQLEEKTIKLFGALTLCNPPNQQLFAKTLYNVIKNHPEVSPGVGSPISGFTRGLILRLLLRNERISIAVRTKNENENPKDANTSFNPRITSNGPLPPRYLAAHPSLHGSILLSLLHQTQLSDVVLQHVLCNVNSWPINEPTMSSSSNVYKKSSLSGNFYDTASISQGNAGAIDAWELSVAAANTAKDKRIKDVRNFHAKQAMLQCKKKSSSKTPTSSAKKDDHFVIQPSYITASYQEHITFNNLKIYVEGLNGYISPNTTLSTLCSSTGYKFGPNLNITLISHNSNDSCDANMQQCSLNDSQPLSTLLSIFAGFGGLALLAHHLPPVCPPLPIPSQPCKESTNPDEWVKLDDVCEDTAEAISISTNEETSSLVPAHSLVALGLLLRLPGYAEALLKEGQRAVYLLRLLLGVMDDGEGKEIMAVCGPGLGTLPFRVLGSLLENLPLSTDDGTLLRSNLLESGTLRLLLLCLAVFTHQQPDSPPSESNIANGAVPKSKVEEKNKLYWAKGTGFGTGSTQQSWNVEELLLRQKTEEEHVTVLLQVIASYIQPGEQSSINQSQSVDISETNSRSDDTYPGLPAEFFNLIHRSALLPAISSYLRNDSVLDMSRHIPLYLAVMRVVRAVMISRTRSQYGSLPTPIPSSLAVIPPLLHQMSCTVDTYAKKLKMNKKTAFSKNGSSNTEGCEDDEGLALLIPDIQATSHLVQSRLGISEGIKLSGMSAALRIPSTASREARYLEVMKRLQFETFEMIGECSENGYKFNVSYHFESTVRAAGEHSHPARMKRLAQEAVTLSTSLPLSYSSSVFVRTDQDRLDIMKVLITGPSDTPYANGCFELDVYFPVNYPNAPMLINLETTGRHSVRFNPNLYLDGKVCLSVLNTWHGRPEEQWNAQTSSFLQVLVSIQSLILVPEPYFNEPGFERSRGTPVGTHHSLEYNSNIYQACVRWAMLEQLRNPTSCFQQVIRTHFWLKRDEICSVIEGWIEELEMQSGDKRTQRNIRLNMIALKRHYKNLREELAKLPIPPGLEDMDTPFNAASTSRDSPVPSSPPHSATGEKSQDMDVDMDQLIKEMVSHVCE